MGKVEGADGQRGKSPADPSPSSGNSNGLERLTVEEGGGKNKKCVQNTLGGMSVSIRSPSRLEPGEIEFSPPNAAANGEQLQMPPSANRKRKPKTRSRAHIHWRSLVSKLLLEMEANGASDASGKQV